MNKLLPLCFAALSACTSVPSSPRTEPLIAFASTRGGNTDLYMAAMDGTGLRRLTTDPAPDQFPRCSPDRRSILFVRGEGDSSELYRLDLADGSQHRLTDDRARDSTPGWSPDGAWVYFTRRDGPHDRIAAIRPDGSGLRFLTDGRTSHDTMPAVSPNGQKLVHHTYRYGRDTELHLIDLPSGTSRRLTAREGFDYEASFAGNDQIVFSTDSDGGHFKLFILEAETGSVHLLADTGADAWGPRHSPTTAYVLFYTGKGDSWRIMRVALGGTPEPVLDDGFSNSAPDWC